MTIYKKWETKEVDPNNPEEVNAFWDSVQKVEEKIKVPLKLSIDVIIEFKGYCNDNIVSSNGDKIIFNAYECKLTKRNYSVDRKLSTGLFCRYTDGTSCHINSKVVDSTNSPIIGKHYIIKGFIQETESEFIHRDSIGKNYTNRGHQSPIMYECDESGNIFMPNHENSTQELISTYNQIFYRTPDEM